MHKLPAFVAVASGLLSLASANAQLAHHYNLSNEVDSVGGANGTISGNASFSNVTGSLTTPGTDNTSYLSLPASVGTGITGNFSIQVFATASDTSASFSTLFSFATTASDNNFLLFNPNRPGNPSVTSANFSQGTIGGQETRVTAGSGLLSDGAKHDLVLTYTSASGAVAIYNNGVLAGSGNVGAGYRFDLAAAGPFNGINGHAPFNDNTFAGSTDDFRIYSSALTAAQVTALDTAGVNASDAQIAALVPEPSTWTAALAGVVALLGLQRFRRHAQA